MSLKIAAQIVKKQGLRNCAPVDTRNICFLNLRTEKVQAQLYGRVLAHIMTRRCASSRSRTGGSPH